MAKKRRKVLYEPPFIKDLSELTVNGQEPQGICTDGSNLTFEICRDGNSPGGGECNPTGVGPGYGYCDFGNNAVEGCTSGGVHF